MRLRVLAAAALAGAAEGAASAGVLRGKSAASVRLAVDGRERVEREGAGNGTSFHEQVANVTAAVEGVSLVSVGKPIRIARGGDITKKAAPPPKAGPSDLKCGVTVKVDSSSDKSDRCPDACPFFAQNRDDTDFCTFTCVAEAECRSMNPHTQIGDEELGVCRSCVVDGCEECDTSTTEDRCAKCQGGYILGGDGLCHFKYAGAWMDVVAGIVGVILVFVVIWVLDMQFRPCYNPQGLEHGLEVRERMKIRQPKNEDGERELWPLTTNLMTTQVAGTGMMLHFSFQAALIIWAVFVALVWMSFCQFVDSDLWRLGTRRFGTPRMNCILVAWGYETQQALMWTKVGFLWIVYIGTVLMCFAYGVYQLRTFQKTDYVNKTMKDFVAMVIGLPPISGEKPVEEDLRTRLETVTGLSVVGVSVAWEHAEVEEEVSKALSDDLASKAHPPEPQQPPQMSAVRSKLYDMERTIFGLPDPTDHTGSEDDGEDVRRLQQRLRGMAAGAASALGASALARRAEAPVEEDPEAEEIREMLQGMHTSPRAFVVFSTQEDMEEAVQKCSDGFEFEGRSDLYLETLTAEPDTVQWVNFGHSAPSEKAVKLAAGFGIILLACLLWGIVFYSPYAYYVMTFNYENGRQPGFAVGFAFSMIVVVGNAIMYEVCARISDWVGFRFKDNREACYMILYTIACMFNVALDFVTTYRTAELVMEGLGFRNYFGVPLAKITEFTAKFETYGMQRSLAENTYAYAFPSTYLIPFLIEPFPTILAPLYLGRLIVRGHPEVQGLDAEEWLGMAEMEMGRYADLLLNTILGILIFYFPGGYTWMLFLGMAGSHVWIYLFDHYRVLRSIPSCTFASFDVEWWAQALMAPIVGIIAACLTFKSNCEPGCHCLRGVPLIVLCSFAWLIHTVFHLGMLTYIIPMFGLPPPEEDPAAGETFQNLSKKNPCTWFTTNPIFCLRSKYYYQHSPPADHFVRGKENLMQANSAIGCFYEGKNPDGRSPKAGGRSPKSPYA